MKLSYRRHCLNLVTRGKDTPLYTESVTKASLFYLDNILLSASSNKLYIHNIKLPEDRQDKSGSSGQFRLVKTVNMSDCKTITSMSCINQFYSFLCIVGCSDRSVRVYDVNQAKVSCPHSDNLSNLPQSKSSQFRENCSKYLILDLNNIESNSSLMLCICCKCKLQQCMKIDFIDDISVPSLLP